jgi:hypothetical protein
VRETLARLKRLADQLEAAQRSAESTANEVARAREAIARSARAVAADDDVKGRPARKSRKKKA